MSRVVMFVYNDVRGDVRVLREAATLHEAGHQVTIVGRASQRAPAGSDGQGLVPDGVQIVLVDTPADWRKIWRVAYTPWRAGSSISWLWRRGRPGDRIRSTLLALTAVAWTPIRAPFYLLLRGRPVPPGGRLSDWLAGWWFGKLGWAQTSTTEAPSADIWHGHDLTGLAAASRAARARGGRLVYDSHELFEEAGSTARRPRWARALLRAWERRWSRGLSALVTVNETLADDLGRRLHPPRRLVVYNCPPRWEPEDPPIDRLRPATGLPADAKVVLYHGAFGRDRGLVELAQAMLQPGLETAHLVYLGFGDLKPDLERLVDDPSFSGRLHVLPGVPINELLAWISAADAGAMVNQPATRNEWLSTPNKLFECLAAGVPVVSSDFPERRRIVMDDPAGPLGTLCDPSSAASIGGAIQTLLGLSAADRDTQRARCRTAADERWNWQTEGRKLAVLYADLASVHGSG